jgi:hypothetical protein
MVVECRQGYAPAISMKDRRMNRHPLLPENAAGTVLFPVRVKRRIIAVK